ncbi:type VI secretion system protein TssA [Malikia spinosa]|uniref:Type VI secretion system protein TssA n=1 Tax=Malikia spinosa TaxID=86180 RepID=A0A7C9MWF4_9BURK|nr:type VI secretion system protein TssA [Malikia spinosa]MYZ52976.1 type VI secretion system protein TssA [Malikia spinosa]
MILQQWRLPLSAACPCGPDLEYDPDFLQLQQVLRSRPEPEFRVPQQDGRGGRTLPDGAPIAWSEVRELAQALLLRSKDLRLAIWLTRAQLHLEGFCAIQQGLELVQLLLQDYWDGVHPGLDPDDGDPTMRLNALAALDALDSVAGDVRASFLLDSRQQGQLTVRELELAAGRLEPPPGETRPAAAQVERLLEVALQHSPELASVARAAPQQLEAIRAVLAERLGQRPGQRLADQRAECLGPAPLPDLLRLHVMLDTVAQAVTKLAAATLTPEPAVPGAELAGTHLSAVADQLSRDGPVAQLPGQINSRQQVVEMLALLCQYLEKNEPTNPVQILLRRAQRMMQMDFLELLRDMAPDGLDQAEKVVGARIARDDD